MCKHLYILCRLCLRLHSEDSEQTGGRYSQHCAHCEQFWPSAAPTGTASSALIVSSSDHQQHRPLQPAVRSSCSCFDHQQHRPVHSLFRRSTLPALTLAYPHANKPWPSLLLQTNVSATAWVADCCKTTRFVGYHQITGNASFLYSQNNRLCWLTNFVVHE